MKKKPSIGLHLPLLNRKLESNSGDLFCFPPWSPRTQVSSSLKAAWS